jgi:four helix bundle protein
MNSENAIQLKSFAFAVRCVNVGKILRSERGEFILSEQLVRSGTSIGANVEEALGGQSRKDFAFKLQIAYKEARESDYWIRVLTEASYLSIEESQSLRTDSKELLALFTAILNTLKKEV